MTAIEILRNEHAVIGEALDLLEHHAGQVAGGGAPLEREFARWFLDFNREFADDTHHAKEEGVLFGLLERRGMSRAGGPLAAMLADHERCRVQAAALERALASGDGPLFAAEALRFVGLLRRHVRLESEQLFEPAAGLLSEDDDVAAVQAFGRVVREREGVLVRQRHLAAIERWRVALGAGPPSGA